MNRLNYWLIDDPREKALRDAIYRAVHRLAATRTSAFDKTARPEEAALGGGGWRTSSSRPRRRSIDASW
jgi:hypothetical protein